MEDDTFKRILQDKQIKAEQKEIIQNVLERKDSMAECYQRASFDFHFSNICHVTTRKLRLPQCIMGDDLHINKQTNIFIANHRRLLRQNNYH
jgi:hypothetical protein